MPQHGVIARLPSDGLFRPQRSWRTAGARRRFLMGVLLFLLSGIICGYWMLTDSQRVRAMAEAYLSDIIGAHVRVEQASLSVFEGLRLEGVTVFVDDRFLPDSRIFSARVFIVRADPAALLAGRLEATQIMALGPHVHLCEDLDTAQWNYQRMPGRDPASERALSRRRGVLKLPEILLRAGLIEYSRIAAGRHEIVGSMAIDGQLTPSSRQQDHPKAGLYSFDLDSRAPGQPSGPRLRGELDTSAPALSARLEDFEFDRTIRLMLPSQVQEWWQAHQLAGRIRIPRFHYSMGQKGRPPDFRIEVELQDVRLAILPEELMGRQEYQRQKLRRPGFPVADMSNLELSGRTEAVQRVLQPQPIALRNVSGRFVFTPDQIRFSGLSGRIENNWVTISGTVGGYDPGDPLNIRLLATNMRIPRLPRYIASLPEDARQEYQKFRPHGRANLALALRRDKPNGWLAASLELDVLDGGFCFEEFAYPLAHARGKVAFGRDPMTRSEWVVIRDLVGHGIEGSPNQNATVTVNGWISPLTRGSGVDIRVTGRDVWLDPPLRAALPEEAAGVLAMFDRRNAAQLAPVELHGGFAAHVSRPAGLKRKMTADVDLRIDYGAGQYREFPYPLRNVTGEILVRPDHVDVNNVQARHAGSTITMDGCVTFARHKPVEPKLIVSARRVPVDDELLSALPPQQRKWLEKIALKGELDVDGRIFLPNLPADDDPGEVDFDLGITLRNGRIIPVDDGRLLSQVQADLRLSRSRLIVRSAQADRDGAHVTGNGVFSWPDEAAQFSLDVQAKGVLADKAVYGLLPQDARDWWNQLRPQGRADVRITCGGAITDQEDAARANETFHLLIQPRAMTIVPSRFPWRMQNVTGDLEITPQKITLKDIALHHGDATVTLSGTGNVRGASAWDLSLSGAGIAIDDELRRAAPEAIASFINALDLRGRLGFEGAKLSYTTQAPPTQDPATRPSASPPSQTEFQGKITLTDGALNAGMPMAAVNGAVDLSASLRNGELHALWGTMTAPSLQIAGRPMKDLQCRIVRPAGRSIYQFADLQGKLANGRLAGQIDLTVPKAGSSRYALRAVLKDVDIRSLVGETEDRVRGRLTGSLDLAGIWDDPRSRQGCGDLQLEGAALYRIPVLFGLIQIANLSLPITSPFTGATAHYSIEGPKLVLERIELISQNMLMQGSGSVDFDSKQVAMSFITNNPDWPRIAFLDQFKREFLQIRVTGTVQEPQVKAKAWNTFTTTVDQVFAGPPETPRKSRRDKR